MEHMCLDGHTYSDAIFMMMPLRRARLMANNCFKRPRVRDDTSELPYSQNGVRDDTSELPYSQNAFLTADSPELVQIGDAKVQTYGPHRPLTSGSTGRFAKARTSGMMPG